MQVLRLLQCLGNQRHLRGSSQLQPHSQAQKLRVLCQCSHSWLRKCPCKRPVIVEWQVRDGRLYNHLHSPMFGHQWAQLATCHRLSRPFLNLKESFLNSGQLTCLSGLVKAMTKPKMMC